MQKRLAANFCASTEGIQKQHEDMIQQGGAVGQLAKERRKALKAVLKVSCGQQQCCQRPAFAVAAAGCSGSVTQRVLAVLVSAQVVADSSLPLEERMRLLSDRFAAVLQDQLAQDKAMADLQEQLQASGKEVDAGGWE